MYSLLVSGAASEQQSGLFRMDRNRFLEYTDDAIASQLRPFSIEAAQCLESWPCILMTEGRGDEIARLGRITGASAKLREVSFFFEPLAASATLTNDSLWKLSDALDIADFEFSRNHFSIKDRDALGVLAGAGYEFANSAQDQFENRPLPAPSRPDLIRARDAIGNWSHTQIDDLLLELGLSDLGADRGTSSRRDRANSIVRYALDHPTAVTAENSLLGAFLVRRTLVESGPAVSPDAGPTAGPAMSEPVDRPTPSRPRSPNRVFVVHGQNEEARNAVVSYLREVGLRPIVLHEQPNMGRHLLTKFIQEAELVTFAIVLMTDDDTGCRSGGQPAPRARQNVILELGYFLSHLGQPRVCALITPGLETPSDFDGIVYIRMDSAEQWQAELERELVAAEMPLREKGTRRAL